MVISFSHPKVRKQLITKGIVYTVRKKKRKQTGRTWWNKGRTLPKEGDVDISYIGEVKPHDLRGYAGQSGFNTTQEWYEAIASFFGLRELKPDTKLYFYAVYSLIECPRCDGLGDIPSTISLSAPGATASEISQRSEFNWLLCPRCKGSKMIRGLALEVRK